MILNFSPTCFSKLSLIMVLSVSILKCQNANSSKNIFNIKIRNLLDILKIFSFYEPYSRTYQVVHV